jgi:putative transposase
VADLLDTLCNSVGTPRSITCDNGPEFTGKALHLWAQRRKVHLNHIQPGKPNQNAFIESFNGTFRDDCLNQHWFNSLEEARLLINHWRNEYNNLRPHSSVGRIPPNSFALTFTQNPTHNLSLNSAAA